MKIKCKICECEFNPIIEKHYISRDGGKTGIVAAFQSNPEEKLYDTFDCPECGCQVVVQERKRTYVSIPIEDIEEDEEEPEEEETIPARPHKKRVPPESEERQ